MTVHGRTADYLDGKLTEEEESAFIQHLPDCAACEAALADELQLRDREEVLGERAGCRKLLRVIRRHGVAGSATVAMKSRWLLRFAFEISFGPAEAVRLLPKRERWKERTSVR
jgi:anti-sigma factor RsiW